MTTVDAYDPMWSRHYETLRARIQPALEGLDARMEHVGSTAVPGLAAKPIIDLDVIVRRDDQISEGISRLESLGYVHRGDLGVEGREAFQAPDCSGPEHHLYLVVEGSGAYRDHVDLRDHLSEHPDDAHRYTERKRAVAHLLRSDREAYVDAKADVIQDILRRAREDIARPN
jgi:GrpB-like predicted nucleotidyltransferase (UPF0157 family)